MNSVCGGSGHKPAFVGYCGKNMVDAALCVYLYNAAAAGRDFDDVDKLVKLYLKKYNKNKKYREILQEVMQ